MGASLSALAKSIYYALIVMRGKSDPEVASSTPAYKILFLVVINLINAQRSKTMKSVEIRLKNERKKSITAQN